VVAKEVAGAAALDRPVHAHARDVPGVGALLGSVAKEATALAPDLAERAAVRVDGLRALALLVAEHAAGLAPDEGDAEDVGLLLAPPGVVAEHAAPTAAHRRNQTAKDVGRCHALHLGVAETAAFAASVLVTLVRRRVVVFALLALLLAAAVAAVAAAAAFAASATIVGAVVDTNLFARKVVLLVVLVALRLAVVGFLELLEGLEFLKLLEALHVHSTRTHARELRPRVVSELMSHYNCGKAFGGDCKFVTLTRCLDGM